MPTRRSFLLGGAGALRLLPAQAVAAGVSDSEELRNLFRDPPRKYSPVPLWWWSGEPVERDRLRWQLERLREGGIFQVTVINLAPAAPWANSFPDSPRFFSDEWWRLFRAVCEDARELGMYVWFYDQIGFSSANIHGDLIRERPEFKGRWLRSARGECPVDGELLATGPDPHQVFYATKAALDTLNPAACRALFDRIHGEFERHAGEFFGKVILGSFQDELSEMPTWCGNFREEFSNRKGYDLIPRLHALWKGADEKSAEVRAHYQQVRAALAEAAFFKPLYEWHERHGLMCGFDQGGANRLGDPAGSTANMGDYLRTHRWYAAPGSDHGGETKIHSSLAHLYGRPRVWLEAFHSSGWGGTLEETFDWLTMKIRAGATLYDPHAVYYSTRGGWWEWAPPSTCWRQPYWRHYPLFSKAVTRLCAALSQGRHVADVGVLYPTATVQSYLLQSGAMKEAARAGEIYHALVGTMDMVRSNVVAGVLDRDRRDFDVLDEASVQERARVEHGALVIGDERYRAIILPGCVVLDRRVAEVLTEFADSGGLLVAVEVAPRDLAKGKARLVEKVEEVPAALASLPRTVDAPVPTLMRVAGENTMLFVPAAHPCATQFLKTRGHYTFDPARYRRNMRILVRGMRSAPEVWDPLTGEARPLAATVTPEGCDVVVPFDNGPAALLVWSRRPRPSSAPAARASRILSQVSGDWDVRLVSTLDNRYGDFDKPNGVPIPLQTWSFDHRSDEKDNWRQVHATFGTFGWWTGPVAEAKLPAPLPPLREDADPLDVKGWKPAVYSLSRGIYKDLIHQRRFGPRGYVPEEFLAFGQVKAGAGVQFRTSFSVAAAERLTLAVSAPAAKQIWIDGRLAATSETCDMLMCPMELQPGGHLLEFRLTAREARDLRGYWALVRHPDRFTRPEWIAAAGTSKVDSWVRFRGVWRIDGKAAHAAIQFAADAPTPCCLRVNGREVAWLNERARVQPCDVTALVREGDNEVKVEIQDSGKPFGVFVDCRAEFNDRPGGVSMSGADWTAARDGGPQLPVRLSGRRGVPDAEYLWRRAHPLRQASWLETTPADDTVFEVVPDALPLKDRVEWLRWLAPPGATSMRFPVAGTAQIFVNGREILAQGGRWILPDPASLRRLCTARIVPDKGHMQGALLNGPVTYESGPGKMEPGNWGDYGLESWSGGVQYRKEVRLSAVPAGEIQLDLGRVRGTAEIRVNGKAAGTCIWSPYRVSVTGLLRPGDNLVEILVLNTLGPYLWGHSATHFVFPGQEQSGMFGPVRLLAAATL